MTGFNDVLDALDGSETRETREDLVYHTTKLDRALYGVRDYHDGALGKARASISKLDDAGDGARAMAREMFARLYGNPERLSGGPEWAEKAHAIADKLPEFEALRAAVSGDADLAALATAEVLKAVAPLADGSPDKARAPGLPSKSDGVRAALRAACAKAAAEAGETGEMLEAMIPGMGRGGQFAKEQSTESASRMQLAERVARDVRMRRVLMLAGQLRRLAEGRRRARGPHRREEVVGIERGNDVGRALPSQLGLLAHPVARKLVQRGIVERTMPQYRLEGRENSGRGPVIVEIDSSGSMNGQPFDYAVAVAVACLGSAHRENRPVVIAHFDTMVRRSVLRAKGGTFTGASGIQHAVEQIVAWRATGSDTAFSQPLTWAMDTAQHVGELKKADLIFVTDGKADVDANVLQRLTAAKKGGMRVFAVTLNGGSLSPAIRALADVAVDIDRADNVLEALSKVVPA